MKTLALLVFSAVLAQPVLSQTVAPADDPIEVEKEKTRRQLEEIRKLKESFKPTAPLKHIEPQRTPAADSMPSAVSSPGEGLPLLYQRLAKNPRGYSLKELTSNLDWTRKNIQELIDFIHPWKKDAPVPTPEQSAAAHKLLAAESAAAAELIKEGDAALAKGIQRDPASPGPLRLLPPLGYASRATYAYANPTPEQRLETFAGLQGNAAGHLSSLIELKRFNPPAAEDEAKTEQWLEAARKELTKYR